MHERTHIFGLAVDNALAKLINQEALHPPGLTRTTSGLASPDYQRSNSGESGAPRKSVRRSRQRSTIGIKAAGPVSRPVGYRAFLEDIGYLVAEGPDFKVTTQNVDDEITTIPGPQLVVPVNNALRH